MDRLTFLDILMESTPEDVNKYIEEKGKIKMVNAITFLDTPEEDNGGSKE